MDPRPYHFEYRRPRLSNPTYQSSHLYDSIYQLKQGSARKTDQGSSNLSIQTISRNPEIVSGSEVVRNSVALPELKRVNSTDLPNKKLVEVEGVTYRYGGRRDGRQVRGQSKMAGIGTSLVRNTSMDQTQVYKRQEKEFNIISLYPKEYKPNLKQFPRLTLQDRLIERGSETPRG